VEKPVISKKGGLKTEFESLTTDHESCWGAEDERRVQLRDMKTEERGCDELPDKLLLRGGRILKGETRERKYSRI